MMRKEATFASSMMRMPKDLSRMTTFFQAENELVR